MRIQGRLKGLLEEAVELRDVRGDSIAEFDVSLRFYQWQSHVFSFAIEDGVILGSWMRKNRIIEPIGINDDMGGEFELDMMHVIMRIPRILI